VKQEKKGGLSASSYPVRELTCNTDFHGWLHVLHLDNWFSSLETIQLCRMVQMHHVGTVRVNRKGLPKEGIFPKKGKGKMEKGTVKCMQKPGEDCYLTAWQDNLQFMDGGEERSSPIL
jgi:hypothetical protein